MGEQLAYPPLAVVPPGLQDDAEPGPPVLVAPAGVHSEHGHLAGRAHPEALEDLDGGGLARAVRPEQREHLAAPGGERDAVEHVLGAVPHPQVADIKYIIHASEDSTCTTSRIGLTA